MKIAICITTFLRDELLFYTLNTIKNYLPDNSIILIGDQGKITKDKKERIDNLSKEIPLKYYELPFDSGLSFGRNYLVKKTVELDIPFVLMGADSIQFTNKYNFDTIIDFLNKDEKRGLVGFELLNSKCPWEFLMDVSNRGIQFYFPKEYINFKEITFSKCDIVRNIFLAKTKSIVDLWDNDLKLGEHEYAFIQYKKRGYNVYWTESISFKRENRKNNHEYMKYRKRLSKYWQISKEKLGIRSWIKYPPDWNKRRYKK